VRTYQGVPISPGIAIGAAVVQRAEDAAPARRAIPPERVEAEVARLREAVEHARGELSGTADEATLPPAVRSIAASHREFLRDPVLLGAVEETIRNGRVEADWAVASVFRSWVERFKALSDDFFRQRHVDLLDLQRRVLRRLARPAPAEEPPAEGPRVLVATELTPSAAAELPRRGIAAFCTESGGSTSHTAIVAKSLRLPAVCGLGRAMTEIESGATLVVDGETGAVVLDPDRATLRRYRERQAALERRFRVLRRIAQLPTETPDGWPVSVLGNIEFPFEVAEAVRNGAEGIGLYRTEFLYGGGGGGPPDEETQLEAYREALSQLRGRPLTIRTFDFGADKFSAEAGLGCEPNPFLGCRSIRFSFARPDLFRTQLRAILRASGEGRVDLLLPMIASVTELRRALAMIDRAKEELHRERQPFDHALRVGVMIEIPAAALGADILAREASFFSIGTNDLTQYTLAVDRTNERVASLFRPANPAILRLLQQTVREAERHRLPVTVCGEMAAERPYTLLLLGLGVRQLSVAPALIPDVKRVVRGVARRTAARVATRALDFSSPEDVDLFLAEETARLLPDA
jgi:phosphotransferase system enzyme I (PtsI)